MTIEIFLKTVQTQYFTSQLSKKPYLAFETNLSRKKERNTQPYYLI